MSSWPLPASVDAVIVSIASWEIECCAPPPIVGQMTSWSLQLFPLVGSDSHWLPPAVTALEWQVEAWPDPDGPHRLLSRGGIIALLAADQSSPPTSELPEPGHRRVRGVLQAGKHGGRGEVWDTFPCSTALVGSVRIITVTDWDTDASGTRSPADGAYELTSVRKSPVHFAHTPPSKNGKRSAQTGLLVRLR